MQPGKGTSSSLTFKLALPTFGDTRMHCWHPQLHIGKLQRYLLAGILVDGPCDKGQEKSWGTWCFALPQFSVVRPAISSPSFLSLRGEHGSVASPFAREEGGKHCLGQWGMQKPMNPDGMCSRVLGKLGNAIARPLSVIFKRLWWLGQFPVEEKKVDVTPVSEKGKKEDLGNYELVSLTLVPGKVMEQICPEAIPSYVRDKKVGGWEQPKINSFFCLSSTLPVGANTRQNSWLEVSGEWDLSGF